MDDRPITPARRLRAPALAVALSVLFTLLIVSPAPAAAAGVAHSWGRNWGGMLGDGTTANKNLPTGLSGAPSFVDMTGGFFHSVGLKSDGTVWTWGDGSSGHLGTGSTTDAHTPVQVTALTQPVVQISAHGDHTLALDSTGQIWQWGWDGYTVNQGTPKAVTLPAGDGPTLATAVAAGQTHSLAIGNDGNLYAWGNNCYGQLGTGGAVSPDNTCPNGSQTAPTPVQVALPSGYTPIAVAAGQWHGVALLQNLTTDVVTVWAWGLNTSGQLGDGTTTNRSTPVQSQTEGLSPTPFSGAEAIAAGDNQTLVLKGGNVYSAGSPGSTQVLTQVSGLSGVVELAAGSASYALLDDGSMRAWGSNSLGELGNGTNTFSATPVVVGGANPLSAIIHIGAASFVGYAMTGTLSASISPSSLDLGDVNVGSTAEDTALLTNTGTAPLVISSISNGDGDWSYSGCFGTTVQPGQTCTITVSFTPSGTGGSEDLLVVPTNAGDDPSLSVFGNGVVDVTNISNVALQVLPDPEESIAPDYTTPIGATEVDVNGIPAQEVPETSGPTESTPTSRVPTSRVPTSRVPTSRVPTSRVPTSRVPTSRVPTSRVPTSRVPTSRVSATVFGNSTLNRFPITRAGGWQAILDKYPARFGDATPETTRFFQLFQPPIDELNPSAPQAMQLKMNEFNLALSPFANLSLAAFLSGDLRWSDVGITPDELPPGPACQAPATADDPTGQYSGINTLIFEADIRGCALDQTPLLTLPFSEYASSPFGKAIWPDITLKDSIFYDESALDDILLSSIPYDLTASPPVNNLARVVRCQSPGVSGVDCDNPGALELGEPATVPFLLTGEEFTPISTGRYRDLGSALDGFTLADVIVSLLPRTIIPWAEFDPDGISVEGYGSAANFVSYQLDFDYPCPVDDVRITLTPHGGFRYRPGSSAVPDGEGGYDPISDPSVADSGAMTYQFGGCESDGSDHVSLQFQLMAGFELGDFGVDVDIAITPSDYYYLASDGPNHFFAPNLAVMHVVETDVSDHVSDPTNGDTGVIYLGQIAEPGDIDAISFSVPPGKVLSVSLNVPEGQDLDLVLYAPRGSDGGVKKLVPGVAKKLNFGKAPVQDAGYFQGGVVRPEIGQEIPMAKGFPVAGVSAFRLDDNEYITTTAVAGDEGEEYILQISGHNGSHGAIAYTAFGSVGDPVPLPECSSAGRSFPYAGEANVSPAAPGVPAGNDPADTLIVLDQQRMRDSFGAAGYTSVMNEINAFVAAQPGGVKSRLLPIDAFADVNAAFATLDGGANRCDPEKINDVVRKITGRIATYRGNASNIVIVGSDEVIPFARLLDKTTDGNEAGYAADVLLDSDPNGASIDANNALAGSFGKGFYLSDNPYGTITPLAVYGDLIYLPQLSLGRIAEQASDIAGQFNTFRVSGGLADGKTSSTDPRRAIETDYDFLIDSGTLITNELKNQFGNANVTRLSPAVQPGNWDKNEFEAELYGGIPPAVASINAHFSHHEGLPASGDATGTTDLFSAEKVNQASTPSLLKRIYYSVGCHFALNVDNRLGAGLLSAADLDNRTPAFNASTLNDWTEAFARKGAAAVIGNLGYGIGDVYGVGYSERLMADFAKYMDGSRSIGASLRDAKISYWLGMGSFTGEDIKSFSQVVLWGFPMYKVPAATGASAAAAVTPIGSPAPDPISGVASTTQFSLTPTFQTQTLGGRQFVSADDGTQNTAPYPVMPKVLTSFPSIPGKKPVFFAPVEVAQFTDQSILQAFSNAVIDTNTDPTVAGNVAYPAVLQNITTAVGLGGTQYQGVVIPAMYFPGADFNGPGTLRKFADSQWMVWYADESLDPEPPFVSSVQATAVGGGTAIVVNATNTDGDPANEVSRVYALVQRAGQSALTRVELVKGTGDRWTGGIAVNDVIRIDAYAVSEQGAGASATFKGLGYPVSPAPDAPDLPAPKSLGVKDGTLVGGWYKNSPATGAPKAFVNDGSGNVDPEYQISIDGGSPQAAPASVLGDGFHTVQAVRVSDGQVVDGAIIVGVDNTAPTVIITSPANNTTLLLNQTVAESYTCLDAGSGIAAGGCTDTNAGSNVNTSSIGSKSFTANATDVVGLTGSATTNYSVKFGSVTGFDPPVDAYPKYDGSGRLIVNSATTKQTIPFKWYVKDANGNPVPTGGTGATYSWKSQAASLCTGGGSVTEPVPSDFVSTPTSTPVYDPATGRWMWNLKKGSGTGCFLFTLKLADNSTLNALFSIK